MELDRTDFGLIDALQHNAAQRLEDLARRVGLAPSSVHERIRRLEGAGVIRRWSIECDAEALGLPVLAFVGLRTTVPCATLVDALSRLSEVEECHSVAGAVSILLKVRVESPAALLTLVERLRETPGIEGTETTVVLATQFDRPFRSPSVGREGAGAPGRAVQRGRGGVRRRVGEGRSE